MPVLPSSTSPAPAPFQLLPSTQPSFPSSFDPAIHLHSEAADDVEIEPSFTHTYDHLQSKKPCFEPCFHPPPSSSSFSNDLEALRQQIEEDKAAKTRQGIVVQHRSWKVSEVFRSEEDYIIDSPSRRIPRPGPVFAGAEDIAALSTIPPTSALPSSPPQPVMAFASSPVAYPVSSSPVLTAACSPRKKRKVEKVRSPLDSIDVNRAPTKLAGFVMSDSEDDEDLMPRLDGKEGQKNVKEKEKEKEGENEAWRVDGGFRMPETYKSRMKETLDEATPLQRHTAISKHSIRNLNIDLPDTGLEGPVITSSSTQHPSKAPLTIRTCTGKAHYISERTPQPAISFERLVASRSADSKPGRARKNYYGIDIHKLMDEASAISSDKAKQAHESLNKAGSVTEPLQSIEPSDKRSIRKSSLLWTEKYRARKFTDLVGDERTHRSVLRWLKAWDPIVFPGASAQQQAMLKDGKRVSHDQSSWPEEQALGQRKILLLAGSPGLGKTTLAHVCARQAGYKVQEINASDERSRDVVRGRIKDMVGTENVRTTATTTIARATATATATATAKIGKSQNGSKGGNRPLCIVVDEVDGVVAGNSTGGGEGGFMKALIDLVATDRRNSALPPSSSSSFSSTATKSKRKGDRFRVLRPIILICNDVYHPSLRPLRQSGYAEIIHVRKAPLNMVVSRLESIFRKENLACDGDAVRRLCEVTWGLGNRREGSRGNNDVMGSGGDGDIRSVIVVAEGMAQKLRCRGSAAATIAAAAASEETRLTRAWIEEHLDGDTRGDRKGGGGGGLARSLGRGSAREVVERVFREGAGFASTVLSTDEATKYLDGGKAVGVAEVKKKRAMEQLREMVETSAEFERIMTDCFTNYPAQPFHDDDYLSKPAAAYEWLHFFDRLNSAVYASQEWELSPYLSSPVLAMHHLFASPSRPGWNANVPNSSFNNRFNSHSASTAAPGSNPDAAGSDATSQPHPLALPTAPYTALELTKQSKETLSHLHTGMSLPIARMYSAPTSLATELAPYIMRILAPAVNPVVVGSSGFSGGPSSSSSSSSQPGSFASVRKASEKAMVARAVGCMGATGVRFNKIRVGSTDSDPYGNQRENDGNGNTYTKRPFVAEPLTWVYRMNPPVDEVVAFGTMGRNSSSSSSNNTNRNVSGSASTSNTGNAKAKPASTVTSTVRYSVRQVLDQEWKREEARLTGLARMRRGGVLANGGVDADINVYASLADPGDASGKSSLGDGNGKGKAKGRIAGAGLATVPAVKRDFFGRPIMPTPRPGSANAGTRAEDGDGDGDGDRVDDGRASTGSERNENPLKRSRRNDHIGSGGDAGSARGGRDGGRIWISFNEGYSNAVRKPITLAELLASF